MAKNKWIKKAIRRPGELHRDLGVPQGEQIPGDKLDVAAHSDNPKIRHRAELAKTLGGMQHREGGPTVAADKAARLYKSRQVRTD